MNTPAVEPDEPPGNAQVPSQPAPIVAVPVTVTTPPLKPKHYRWVLILLGILVAVGVVGYIAITLLFVIVFGSLKTISNTCDQTEATTAQNVKTIRAETSQLRINGQAPASFSARSTGDCLTNGLSRATGTADFTITEPDLATANAQVINSLGLLATNPQHFELSNESSPGIYNSPTPSVVTQMRSPSGRYVEAEYNFANDLDCQGADAGICHTVIFSGPQAFGGHPINEIFVQLQNVPFSPL